MRGFCSQQYIMVDIVFIVGGEVCVCDGGLQLFSDLAGGSVSPSSDSSSPPSRHFVISTVCLPNISTASSSAFLSSNSWRCEVSSLVSRGSVNASPRLWIQLLGGSDGTEAPLKDSWSQCGSSAISLSGQITEEALRLLQMKVFSLRRLVFKE